MKHLALRKIKELYNKVNKNKKVKVSFKCQNAYENYIGIINTFCFVNGYIHIELLQNKKVITIQIPETTVMETLSIENV